MKAIIQHMLSIAPNLGNASMQQSLETELTKFQQDREHAIDNPNLSHSLQIQLNKLISDIQNFGTNLKLSDLQNHINTINKLIQ
jgi:hypothetical protein